MSSKTKDAANEVFARWRAEDAELNEKVDSIRQWMHELDQLGRQHFGETATRLRSLRELMVEHFSQEGEMVEQLGKLYSPLSPEVASVRRKAESDHEHLLHRVDDFIARLNQLEPPFRTWQQAIDEMEGFASLLEQHETNEWDSIEMLLPS
jgi:predicted  nucleic acid-binding Zn-ribbon protein